MNRNIIKLLGFVFLTALTITSCKKETTTASSASTDVSSYQVKLDNLSFNFSGDKSGFNKDTTLGAIIIKDDSLGLYTLSLFEIKKDLKEITDIKFLISTSFNSFSTSKINYGIKDSITGFSNRMDIITNSAGKMISYQPYDVQLVFNKSTAAPSVGSILSGSISGKVYKDDNNNSENITIENLPSISATFKAVLIDEFNENSSQTFVTNNEYQKSILDKYLKLLKSQDN
jgi:hypothetical protein